MVEYDDNNNALTLGDDDSLNVGDYELKYSSINDQFEVEHPNGEISNIPRSTSGSLVPRGLAESVAEGKALADNGEMYDSVQTAVDNASGFVFVGPGTFNEAVNISKVGFTLEGSGNGTIIDGGTAGSAVTITANNVSLKNFKALCDSGTANATIDINASKCTVSNLDITDAGTQGINVSSFDNTIANSYITNTQAEGIQLLGGAVRCAVKSCTISSLSGAKADGIAVSDDDCIVSNNIISNAPDFGVVIRARSDDNIIIGNRVISSGNDGIDNRATNNILANNRISDSGSVDLVDSGTGTVTDANLTGPSN